MSRCFGIALVALLVGMPVAVWAGPSEETAVVTDAAASGVTQKEKRRGGHARLGKVAPAQPSDGAATVSTGTAAATPAQLEAVTTTEGADTE